MCIRIVRFWRSTPSTTISFPPFQSHPQAHPQTPPNSPANLKSMRRHVRRPELLGAGKAGFMLGFASAKWLRFVFLPGGQVGLISQPHPRPPQWLRFAITPASIWRPKAWGYSRRGALPRRTRCKNALSVQALTIPTRPPLWNRKGARRIGLGSFRERRP
jgi:hypothetical protein